MSALEQVTNLTQQIWKPRRLNTVVFFVTSVYNIHDSVRYSPKVLTVDIPFTYFETRPLRS